MKSLDIAFENIALDDCSSHQVKIEYTGGIQRGRLQGRTHTVTVAYSSLSKKLQSIHRLGGKIVNVSISRFQVDLAEVDTQDSDVDHEIACIPEAIAEIAQTHGQPIELEVAVATTETIDQVGHDGSTSPEMAVIITEDIVETIPEVIAEPEIIAEELEVIAEEPAIIAESEVIAAPEIISEIASEIIDVIAENTAAVEELTVVAPKKSKSSSAIAAKPKKSRTSTKASHGFSKRDTKSQIQELQAIPDVIEASEQIEESKPEQSSETVAEIIEVIETSEPVVLEPVISEITAEEITASTPESSSTPKSLAKSKKSKVANKSGHGFNKSKGDR